MFTVCRKRDAKSLMLFPLKIPWGSKKGKRKPRMRSWILARQFS